MTDFACYGVGRTVQRTCTDKICYGIFAIANLILIGLLIAASSKGDIKKITHGTDYNGNVCGQGYPANLTISEAEWKSLSYLWYPFSYDSATKEFRIASAIDYAICVSDCNPSSNVVSTYGGALNPTPQVFAVLFKSSDTFNRCVPDFNSYICPNGNCTNTNSDASNGDVARELGFTGFFFGLVQQVYKSMWITFIYFLAAVVLCFVWIIVLRRAVKPVVMVCIGLAFAVGVAITISLFAHYKSLENDAATHGSDGAKIALIVAIAAAVGTFIFACVMVFMRKSIMLSCDIIEEGTRIIVDVPSIMLVPIFTSLIMFGYIIMFASIAALLYTVGSSEVQTTEVENSNGQMVTVKSHSYDRPQWVDAGQVFNFFMMLWVLAFQNGVAYMTIAMSGVSWFFSAPGNVKDTTDCSVFKSYGTTVRYHSGTVAFGTLLFAIVSFARMVMRAFEKSMRKTRGENAACCLILCCAECCLSCLERIIKFLTEHGFVMTAMTGKPLIPAAKEAVALLTATPAVLAINVISDVVLSVSRLLITGIITLAGVASLNAHGSKGSSDVTVAACGLVLATGTWFIAGAFTHAMTVCIDTTLLCFAYDVKHHNGMDRPYYAPDDLKVHIEKASARHAAKHAVEEGLLNKERV